MVIETMVEPERVHSLRYEIKVEFRAQPNGYCNGTQCTNFNPILFIKDNWQEPQQVDMSFIDYACFTDAITATDGEYNRQYQVSTFVVYACDGQARHD
ncbi:unnamed protein product [Rotaria sp. Silwood2]|nr:unnamed protein product [Rotaria sp. Silwood2]